jgi:hypothetical protein
MPYVYFDQDVLITLGRGTTGDAPCPLGIEVRRRIEAREIQHVLSLTHLMDTAGGASEENSRRLVEFIESLGPFWLLERTRLHRLEIRCFLNYVPFEQLRDQAICKSVSEVVASLSGLTQGGTQIVNLQRLVLRFRNAEDAFGKYYLAFNNAFRTNAKAFKAGAITPAKLSESRMQYIRQVANITPGTVDDRRLHSAPPDALRSIVCASEIMRESWVQGQVMNGNSVRDRFHGVVAMPYSDVMVTSDKQMIRTISAVKKRLSFPVAKLVGSMRQLLGLLDGEPIR